MSADTATGPFCTALGCRSDAVYIIATDAGERPVCPECAETEAVIRHV